MDKRIAIKRVRNIIQRFKWSLANDLFSESLAFIAEAKSLGLSKLASYMESELGEALA